MSAESATPTLKEASSYKWIGKPLKVRDDLPLIAGKGTYMDDIVLPNTVYLAYANSRYAHAKIKNIDISAALNRKGVLYVMTGKELAQYMNPFPQLLTKPPAANIKDYPLAVDKVRYVGEPIAAVVATDRYTAEDAAELIDADYEPLKPVLNGQDAIRQDAPVIHEEAGTNIVWSGEWNYGDVDTAFKNAYKVIKDHFYFHRYASAPLEPNIIISSYDWRSGSYTIYANQQMPMFVLPFVAYALKVQPSDIRMIVPPNTGGAFGGKIMQYVHMPLLAILSKLLRRPVKYVETRTENIIRGTHDNERSFDVEVAVSANGRLLGIKADIIDNTGAYPRYEPAGAAVWSQVLTGMYNIKNIHIRFTQVVSNKGPTSPVRGYARVQQNFMWELAMDRIASELGLDPVDVRITNFIKPDEMPYEAPNGTIYDGGDYPRALKVLAETLEYNKFRELQREYRSKGKLIGIGFGSVIDSAGNNFAQVKILDNDIPLSGTSDIGVAMIDYNGNIVVYHGGTDAGQSHAQLYSQIAAEVFDIDPMKIIVKKQFDSDTGAWMPQSGAYASRTAVLGGTATYYAAVQLREKVLKIAAHLLKEDISSLYTKDGVVISKDSGRKITLAEIANVAWTNVLLLPPDMEPGLYSRYAYKPDFKNNLPDSNKKINNTLTYAYTIHGTVVEIDPETFEIKILRHVVISDPGVAVNPIVVEGQELGATMHGISAALYEAINYDEVGNPLNTNFLYYGPIGATEMPDVEIKYLNTRSLTSPLGTRGIGEGGGGPIASIINAINDALKPLGVRVNKSHIEPEEIARLVKGYH